MADGSLVFNTRIDTKEFVKGTVTLKSQANKVAEAMEKAGREAEDALNIDVSQTVSAFQKVSGQMKEVSAQADQTGKKIEQILSDGSRSAKSKAASIAAVYKQQGLSQSEAMTKAWEHIERGAKDSGKGIRNDTEKTAKHMKKQFSGAAGEMKQQFSGMAGQISSVLKKIGGMLAGTFAVGKLISLGKEAISFASDLQEVQNVVDTAFGDMGYKMEQFAESSIENYGISKLTAKEMGSTYMAMAKGIGLASAKASDMALQTTARTADIMSFYNKSASEAQTMMKSIYTGETESLKAIGVVMTEANLQNFAYEKGIQKKISAMTEQEKVMLRYQYVMQQTALAEGDFAKTSGSWANQTRILSEQWKELLGILGNGLIQVLTPVVRFLNTALSKLISFATAAGEALSKLFGVSTGTTAAAAVAADAETASGALEDMTDAQQEAANATSGIDELNVISQNSGNNGTSGDVGAALGGNMATTAEETKKEETAVDQVNNKIQGLIDKGKELAGVFTSGFWDGFGDISPLNTVQQSLDRIRDVTSDIFSNETVAVAMDSFVQKTLSSFGIIAGATLSIGASITDNLFGGIERYLEQNTESIQDHVANLFDLSGRSNELSAKFADTAAVIFSSLRSESAKQITADIIGMFSEGFLGVTELAGGFALDVADLLISPFANNKEEIQKTLEDTFAAVQPVTSGIREFVTDTFSKVQQTYEDSVAPMFESFKAGFTEIVEKLLEGWNTHILPVIQAFGARFQEFKEKYLSPLIDKFLEFAGKVSEAITAIWENALQPFVLWFMGVIYPVIADALAGLGEIFFGFWETVCEVAGFILDALGGLMDFITGVFTGDWGKAWSGIKEFFSGIWNGIKTILKTVFSAIVSYLKAKLKDIGLDWEKAWSSSKEFVSNIWQGIKTAISNVMSSIKTGISTALTAIKSKFTSIFTSIKNTVTTLFSGMWNGIKGIINSILGGIEGMANGVVRGVNRVIGALNSLSFDIPDWIPGLGGQTFGFNIPTLGEISIPRLAQGGFIPANTPRLAMIGDNRTQGEIVSPEDKLQEMAYQAAMMASQNNLTGQYLQIMIELLRQIIELIENLDLVVNIDIRELRKKLKDLEKRSGYGFSTT